MIRVHLFSHPVGHSTARYFSRAIKASGQELIEWSVAPELEQIKPKDLFVFVDPLPDWPIGLEALNCRKIAYLIDVHQNLPHRLNVSKFFDAVFVAQKGYLGAFKKIGHKNVHWLPLACDPDIHCAPAPARDIDVGFVGKLGQAGTQRHSILTTVLPQFSTNDYSQFQTPSEMAKIYGRSKIVFNASINGDVNMRIFEAWASGALLVTDRIENGFGEMFQDGLNCVCYSSIKEAVEKISYYLKADAERERIAAAGHQAAIQNHTYAARWQAIYENAVGISGSAPVNMLDRRSIGSLTGIILSDLRKPKRTAEAMARYGFSISMMKILARAAGRSVNAHIPLTPNAIKARLKG